MTGSIYETMAEIHDELTQEHQEKQESQEKENEYISENGESGDNSNENRERSEDGRAEDYKREENDQSNGREEDENESSTEDQSKNQIDFSSYHEKAKKMGCSAEDAIEQLFAAHEALEKDPAKALAWLKEQYGVKGDLAEATIFAQREKEINDGKLLADFYSLREARDDKGSLKYPHFQSLEGDILSHLQSGKASDAPKAYDMAFWGNETLREKHLAELKEKAKIDVREEIKQQEADYASTQNIKTKGAASSGENQKESFRQTMSHIYDELTV